MFVIRVRATNLLFPTVGGKPPTIFATKTKARRKLRYEIAKEHRDKYEIVPYDKTTMAVSAKSQ